MRSFVGAIALFASVSTSWAAGAPKEIQGKSFVVTTTEDRVQRHPPDGEWYDRQLSRTAEVYISSAGRVFKRERVIGNGNDSRHRGRQGPRSRTGQMDQVAGGERTGRLDVAFRGNTILLTVPALRGASARQTMIQFDGSGQSCQATVIQGKGEGTSSFTQRNLVYGGEIEVRSVKTGPAGCSVVNGNVFE